MTYSNSLYFKLYTYLLLYYYKGRNDEQVSKILPLYFYKFISNRRFLVWVSYFIQTFARRKLNLRYDTGVIGGANLFIHNDISPYTDSDK